MVRQANHYELAFANWLAENRFQHAPVDQRKRRIFARDRIKTFDFILYPQTDVHCRSSRQSPMVMAEVKGRIYKGTNLTKLTNLQNWVTMEDIRGLLQWEQIFSSSSQQKGSVKSSNQTETPAVFIFAYKFQAISVETGGKEVYDFAGRRYMFYAMWLDDYRMHMTKRSEKWQTVSLPADKFRLCAVPVRQLLTGKIHE